ncbi:Solitary outer membrane autotransporter beta-barrel domain [Shewanella sp. KX20019]|uniref:Solitary outer membrane autotransporter beta-barrel domain n=1 Tax=Shewanella sp. KX20019 TaxID=2803864 RepID=UPI001928D2FB|nr:Solitary outer membrane autotransporter beta-barrel domain [Shewanella sp. KX20019]QQX82211.1 Solitary outer membrane autotransporter beta-barrel domain [Shewanella sp. KX20019]
MRLLNVFFCQFCLSILLGTYANAAVQSIDSLDAMVSNVARQNIATSIVLTDANLITLGVVNFDPSSVVDLAHLDTGSESSLQRRRELKTYSLPWTSSWSDSITDWQTSTYLKLSYIGSKQSVDFSQPANQIDQLLEKSYLFQAEQRWRYPVSEHWKALFGIGAQAIWYENKFEYRSVLKQFESLFDNGLLNTSYGALMIDPSIEFRYDNLVFGHRWQFISRYRFAIGRTLFTDSAPQDVSIKVGRFSNTLMFHYQLPKLVDYDNELRLMFKRIDLSGDAVAPLATDHFYEVGAGWVIDTPWLSSLIDNIGLGVTVNIGSVLSGGSVLLLFNEDI